jgi:PDZ domain-containing secreted protein
MKLGHGMALAEVLDLKLDLATEIAKVLGRPFVVLGDDLVAHRFAERNVDVDRQRQCHGPSRPLLQRLDVVAFRKRLHEPVSRGVRGIAGTGHIEPLEQFV